MSITRRTFLQTGAAAGLAAALPAFGQSTPQAAGLFPPKPNFHNTPSVSIMLSGGSITQNERFLPEVAAAQQHHFAGRKRILLILHASLPEDRDRMEQRLQGMFAAEGFEAYSIHHLSDNDARRRIQSAEAIFIGGGETFLLLRTLLETRQLRPLRDALLSGVPMHGTSAGANIAGPHIGCTNDFPVVDVPSRTALGVFPAVINPHHPRADHADFGGRAHKIRTYLRANPGETVLGLGNAAVVRLQGGRVDLSLQPAFIYQGTSSRELASGEVAELSALVRARASSR
jgi:dipeptidase E